MIDRSLCEHRIDIMQHETKQCREMFRLCKRHKEILKAVRLPRYKGGRAKAMTVTAVLMMQSIAMHTRTQALTSLLLYFSLCTDCLQTLALCPVLPHHTDALQQQDPLQEVLPGGPAEVSLHIA